MINKEIIVKIQKKISNLKHCFNERINEIQKELEDLKNEN